MPIAAYTLDENDLVHADGSADSSMDSNSSSMTAVDDTVTFTEGPLAKAQSNVQKPFSTTQNPVAFKTVYAGKGVLARRLSGNRRMRSSSSHLHATSSLSQTQRKLRFSNPAFSGIISSNVRKTSKTRVVPGVQGKPSYSAMNAADDTHFNANLLSGRKSQIPHAQLPATTEEAKALQEFIATVPENLQRSVDFQNLLTRAANKATRRQLNSRSEATMWKFMQSEGYRQSDGTLRLPVGPLLKARTPEVVDLNIGDVFQGRRFRISVS